MTAALLALLLLLTLPTTYLLHHLITALDNLIAAHQSRSSDAVVARIGGAR